MTFSFDKGPKGVSLYKRLPDHSGVHSERLSFASTRSAASIFALERGHHPREYSGLTVAINWIVVRRSICDRVIVIVPVTVATKTQVGSRAVIQIAQFYVQESTLRQVI